MDAPFGFKSAYGTQNAICSLHSTAIKSLQKKIRRDCCFMDSSSSHLYLLRFT